MIFTLPKPLPDNDHVFSWVIVGGISAWGGIVRYLMENKDSGENFSWHEVFNQVVISGFTGLVAGVYSYEQGYSELMVIVFSGLGGALGGHLLDLIWKRFAHSIEKENSSKH